MGIIRVKIGDIAVEYELREGEQAQTSERAVFQETIKAVMGRDWEPVLDKIKRKLRGG